MRRVYIVMLVVLGVATPVAADLKTPAGFEGSYNEALTRAVRENKPLYVYFAIKKSDLCRRFEQDIHADANGKQAIEPFVTVFLDCTPGAKDRVLNRTLLEKHGGAGYPFLLLLAPDGAVLDTWTGYVPVKDFVPRIHESRDKLDRYNAFQERAKAAEPDDFRFHLEALDMYASTRQWIKMEVAASAILAMDKDGAYRGRVKLAQLQAARANRNANTVARLVADIRALDPNNAEHHLETALKDLAGSMMVDVTPRTLDLQFRKALAVLVERAALKNLQDPLQAKVDVGLLQANYGRYKDARFTLETLLAEKPDLATTANVQSLIQRIKQMEAQAKK